MNSKTRFFLVNEATFVRRLELDEKNQLIVTSVNKVAIEIFSVRGFFWSGLRVDNKSSPIVVELERGNGTSS